MSVFYYAEVVVHMRIYLALMMNYLARKIFECPIPIISGVGHEIDWTIGDYAADLRNCNTTAAAELITQSHYDLENRLQKYIETLKQNIENIFNIKSQEFDYLQSNLKHPQAALKEQATKLDFLGEQLKNAIGKYHKIQNVK